MSFNAIKNSFDISGAWVSVFEGTVKTASKQTLKCELTATPAPRHPASRKTNLEEMKSQNSVRQNNYLT